MLQDFCLFIIAGFHELHCYIYICIHQVVSVFPSNLWNILAFYHILKFKVFYLTKYSNLNLYAIIFILMGMTICYQANFLFVLIIL